MNILQVHPVTGIYFPLPLCPHWVQTLPVAVAIYSQGNKDYLSERWITRRELSPLALGWQRGRCVWDLVQGLAEIGQIYKNNHILGAHVLGCMMAQQRHYVGMKPSDCAAAASISSFILAHCFCVPAGPFTTIIWCWIQINTTPCGPLEYKKHAVVLCRAPVLNVF